jgi:hypothetical protein
MLLVQQLLVMVFNHDGNQSGMSQLGMLLQVVATTLASHCPNIHSSTSSLAYSFYSRVFIFTLK